MGTVKEVGMADPVTAVVVPGFLGGLVIAAVSVLLQRRRHHAPSLIVPYRPLTISTDVINMASIKVAGVGGLGLVALSAVVALNVPRIFEATAMGLALGACMAVILIVRRAH
jgi:hypothetical protein